MKWIYFFLVTALLYTFSFTAIAESETVKGAQKDLASFQESAKKQLAEIGQKIEQIKNKAKSGTDAKAKQTAEGLEKSRLEVEHKLQEMKEASENNVKSLKEQIGDSLNHLNSKVQSALRD